MEAPPLYRKIMEARENEERIRRAQAPVIAHYERELARYRMGARFGLAILAVGAVMLIAAALMQ